MIAMKSKTKSKIPRLKKQLVQLIASGDLRLSANQVCWPAQKEMEATLTAALAAEGYELVRAHEYDDTAKHGFIDSQRKGMEVFKRIDPTAPLIIAEAVWQYSITFSPDSRRITGRSSPWPTGPARGPASSGC